MKLRNKKTGEIVRVEFLSNWQTDDGTEMGFRECNTNIVYSYNSLAELNEEWEDVSEEPTEYWSYDTFDNDVTFNRFANEDDRKADQEIGNYFATREEAEQAVEKLKAWKRLKDKGFKFIGVRGIGKAIDFDIPEPFNHVGFDEYVAGVGEKEFYNDLLLLFGGEE